MVLSMGAIAAMLGIASLVGLGATAVGAYEDKRNMNYNQDEAQKARDYNTHADETCYSCTLANLYYFELLKS